MTIAIMEKLSTIQKQNNLNKVYVKKKKGPGGGYHEYEVVRADGEEDNCILEVQFQNGARHQEGSTVGVLDVDLLEIVRHRIQAFQKGEFATRENALALTAIEEALLWMNKRTEDRAERNVLGTLNK